MTAWRKALAASLLVILMGCGGGSDNTDGTPPTSDSPSEPTSEPPVEPTEPETTQPTRRLPSIEIPSAPIGGNVRARGNRQCAEVNWLGREPIPDGTTIKVGSPHLEPRGVFDLDQTGCAENRRSCAEVYWQASAFKPCYVGVRQIANSTDDVQLIMPVTATCKTEVDCQSLDADQGGSQISFSPIDLAPSPESPESPESPTSPTS
jgi:hypothetical protein